ncbi:uncharacterized protein VTP21DRAFT_573 [Calcarisporiella thermophila]|uniref:uncharacterized protein n=1 Tax=Calcarisporiella thermophila TaxID=911321 RepID=UPI003742D671
MARHPLFLLSRSIVPRYFLRNSNLRIAHLHTTPISKANIGILGRMNPWAKATKQVESQQPKSEKPHNTNDKNPLDKIDLSMDVTVDNVLEEAPWKRADPITEPEEIRKIIKEIVLSHTQVSDVGEEWLQIKLDSTDLKFQILKESIVKIGKDIPNLELNNIATIQDAVDYFIQVEEPISKQSHPVAYWFKNHADELPPNMQFVPYVKERGVKRGERLSVKKREGY